MDVATVTRRNGSHNGVKMSDDHDTPVVPPRSRRAAGRGEGAGRGSSEPRRQQSSLAVVLVGALQVLQPCTAPRPRRKRAGLPPQHGRMTRKWRLADPAILAVRFPERMFDRAAPLDLTDPARSRCAWKTSTIDGQEDAPAIRAPVHALAPSDPGAGQTLMNKRLCRRIRL